ncbi:uncharacterized protein LOC103723761 isoform X3 [Phoenix dactylifera]|nr:uncharacterized protein LOC103723761 isoform X3 [Phoenix dactylifera]XP_008813011.2 uncharacterized protein LOC103723761 isoform X4 [Phoenix dactylifera]XP_038972130.1 uncharacterized protein LOC103723761 isoform X3 [Phoenix dactylifera]
MCQRHPLNQSHVPHVACTFVFADSALGWSPPKLSRAAHARVIRSSGFNPVRSTAGCYASSRTATHINAGMAAIWTSARPPPFFSHDVRRLSRSSLSLYVYISLPSSPSLGFRRAHLEGIRSLRCFSRPRGGSGAPPLLKIAVGGVTELLRLFSPDKRRDESRIGREVSLARGVDDVVQILKSDYDRAYFLTGNFNSDIYAEDCLFEDPTIKFRGKAQYSQNLELLVPFFDHPSLKLEKIEKGSHDEVDFILATWKLRLLGMLKVGMFLHLKRLDRYLNWVQKMVMNDFL